MQIQHIAFYRFVAISDPHAIVRALKIIAKSLLGSVLIAGEGINGTLAGSPSDLDKFERALTEELAFAGLFNGMRFQRTDCQTAPFGRLKIRVRPEIVDIGVLNIDASGKGIDVSASDWDALIAEDDVVLLDNRNHFEFELGHFNSAQDPGVFNYRDFAAFVEQNLPAWQSNGKRVAMYCTGGIRCEKLGGWMQHGLGLDVYQLEGGVLNYFQALPDANKDWVGECFVFDNRIALDTRLRETATTAEQVYADGAEADPNNAWRLLRARRLDESA